MATGGSGGSVLLLTGLIAHHRGWWPFRTRSRRPFARAVRELRRNLRNHGDEQTYRTALQTLHRAFDATAKRRLLAEDLPIFFDTAPAFRPLQSDIERFFAASRQAFFRTDDAAALHLLPPEALVDLGGRLAAAERAAG
jgi:mxaA protein